MKWPNFILLGAVIGRFIGTLYKFFARRSQSLKNQQDSFECIQTNRRHKLGKD